MAVVLKTSSGKAVQFIDEEGNVFMTSVSWLKTLLYGNKKMIELTRMPYKANPGRFRKSPVLDLGTGKKSLEPLEGGKELTNANDAFGTSHLLRVKREKEEKIKDVEEW
jgi:hypothetical protein